MKIGELKHYATLVVFCILGYPFNVVLKFMLSVAMRRQVACE